MTAETSKPETADLGLDLDADFFEEQAPPAETTDIDYTQASRTTRPSRKKDNSDQRSRLMEIMSLNPEALAIRAAEVAVDTQARIEAEKKRTTGKGKVGVSDLLKKLTQGSYVPPATLGNDLKEMLAQPGALPDALSGRNWVSLLDSRKQTSSSISKALEQIGYHGFNSESLSIRMASSSLGFIPEWNEIFQHDIKNGKAPLTRIAITTLDHIDEINNPDFSEATIHDVDFNVGLCDVIKWKSVKIIASDTVSVVCLSNNSQTLCLAIAGGRNEVFAQANEKAVAASANLDISFEKKELTRQSVIEAAYHAFSDKNKAKIIKKAIGRNSWNEQKNKEESNEKKKTANFIHIGSDPNENGILSDIRNPFSITISEDKNKKSKEYRFAESKNATGVIAAVMNDSIAKTALTMKSKVNLDDSKIHYEITGEMASLSFSASLFKEDVFVIKNLPEEYMLHIRGCDPRSLVIPQEDSENPFENIEDHRVFLALCVQMMARLNILKPHLFGIQITQKETKGKTINDEHFISAQYHAMESVRRFIDKCTSLSEELPDKLPWSIDEVKAHLIELHSESMEKKQTDTNILSMQATAKEHTLRVTQAAPAPSAP